MMRLAAALLGGLVWTWVVSAQAASSVLVGAPEVDADTGELVLLAGGLTEAGRPARLGDLELLLDAEKVGPPSAAEALSEHAAEASEASARYRPPLGVGLVYLWTKGVPSGVLDGVHAYFKRLPRRTTVYPTIYGRLRQGRARITAANISALDEAPHLDGDRPNLGAAVRMNLVDLAADTSPLRIMLLVTDGRDFADPKGEGPGDFAALGEEIRKAGIHLQVVSFPASDADAAGSAESLRELTDAAAGFRRAVDRPEELEPTLESMGQAVADLQRLRFKLPWGAGGSPRVRLRMSVDGRTLTVDAGKVAIEGGRAGLVMLVVGGLLVVGLVVGGTSWWVRARGRGRGEGGDEREVLDAVHEMVRRGVPPARAVAELTRSFPQSARLLVDMEPASFSDGRYPYFRTRAGRMRLDEIRELLSDHGSEEEGADEAVLAVLVATASGELPPDKAAQTLTARASADACDAFSRMSLKEVGELLKRASKQHPVLAKPRARALVMEVQDELRRLESAPVSVAWLVRATGPGRRGESFRVGRDRIILGRSSRADLRIEGDPGIVEEHAEIVEARGEYTIAALGTLVRVEDTEVVSPRRLSDGDTIELGGSRFVFKAVAAGNLVAARRSSVSHRGVVAP